MKKLQTAGICALVTLIFPSALPAQQAPVKFPSPGVRLQGPQFAYDVDFEVLDWNDNGKPDLFLYGTGVTSGTVHLNKGTLEAPRFGHSVYYPYNTTETEPQTIEHTVGYSMADLNHDGRFDFIWYDGEMRYAPNTNTKHGPNHWKLYVGKTEDGSRTLFPGTERFRQENARIVTGPESMYWNKGIFPRQVISFTAADWDGDGLQDLLISRFKGEAPGVHPNSGTDDWGPWGRTSNRLAVVPDDQKPTQDYTQPLKSAPARGLYFYKNLGTKTEPMFDAGVEILTPDSQSIAAPNPVVFDVDGDGVLDIVSTEAPYHSNAFRVDWPTAPHVQWFRRAAAAAADVNRLEPARSVTTADGQPVPAGNKARFADLRKRGVADLLVMNPNLRGTLSWYKNSAANATTAPALQTATELTGPDFNRFDFMAQPLVVDWFGKGSRDLILFGNTDAGCKWALRRMALYRNVAKQPGEVAYQFVGWFNYNGDLRMCPVDYEERQYEAYGNSLSCFPGENGEKQFVASVGGKLFFFSDLDKDGLTFRNMTQLKIPRTTNSHKGWQEIDIKTDAPVKHIRIGNDPNGMGNLRDSFLHVLQFEALSGGKNVALWNNIEKVKTQTDATVPWYQVQRPELMFTPGNKPRDDQSGFTSWGFFTGPLLITLKEAVKLDKIRFLLSDRDTLWYKKFTPFAWQGKGYRAGFEEGELWYNYRLEVSTDGEKWTMAADRMNNEMLYSHPVLVDWDKDGKTDLFLGVTSSTGIYPSRISYRLYLNQGTNDTPKYSEYLPITDEAGKPLSLQAASGNTYGAQSGLRLADLNDDGKLDMITEYGTGFNYYENAGNSPTSVQFKIPGQQWQQPEIRGPGNEPLRLPSRYRFFDLVDVDGSGSLDLLISDDAKIMFFKGVAANAPAEPKLTVGSGITKATAGEIDVAWPRVANATSYDVRWSAAAPVTELNWSRLAGAKVVANGEEALTTSLKGLPADKEVEVAVKALDDKGLASGLVSLGRVTVPATTQVVLRNGPAASAQMPKFAGTEAVTLDANKPGETIAGGEIFEVRSQMPPPNGEKQRLALVRFSDLPKMKVGKALLQLHPHPQSLEQNVISFGPVTFAMTAQSYSGNWDPAAVNWSQLNADGPKTDSQLDEKGTFQSYLQPVFQVLKSPLVEFDVTQALQEAQREGKSSVTLMLRVPYTGHYAAGVGYQFHGPESPQVEARPRLVLTGL